MTPGTRFNHARPLLALCAAALASCASMQAVDAPSALNQANAAMGGVALKSIQYDAAGTGGIFGQAYQPGMAWPKLNVTMFSRVMDYDGGALRQDIAQNRAEPTGGGPLPLMGTGEQRATGLLKGNYAWNMAGPAPAASPLAVSGRVHDLWTSPHGAIKAALKSNNGAWKLSEDGKTYTAVDYGVAGQFTARAFINDSGLVERVDSVQPSPVMGDTATTTWYSDYKDVGGVKFPMRIRQAMGGYEVFDLTVKDVKPNVAVNIETPALVPAFAERAAIDKVADGVWFVGGGSHNSVAIEMADHMILVESPLYDGRAAAVLAEVKKLSNKPIRYVINSHHHFDHAGGLRTAVADGAEVVSSAMARPYFERIFANANTVQPDALARSGKRATVSGVDGKRVFSDGTRTVEVYFIEGSVHAFGFNMVYLPKEKLLVEADAYTPGAPNTPTPAVINANNLNLVQNMDRLKLAVDRILPLHGRVVPVAELYTAVGRK
jgi:glyoxylase-like metal-dependent hydrolase (beta-lactamase superfamily II)